MNKSPKPGGEEDGNTKVFSQRFDVSYEYPVFFTHGALEPANPLLAKIFDRRGKGHPHRVIVFIDSGVVEASPDVPDRITAYFNHWNGKLKLVLEPRLVGGGESSKNGWNDVRKAMSAIGDCRMDRQNFVLAIGGGSVLDMVGFATALVHRGLRLVRMPTTVLAQNDAGVGVKNGMNEREVKNFIGVFAPPWAVLNDYDFLRTLKFKDWVGGVSEAFKVALIKDEPFFRFLCGNASRIRARDMGVMEKVVYKCARLHLEHIAKSGDPFEFGSSRPLDFGHWSAHKLESMSDFQISHGQAVAIGVALDSYYAMRTGLISDQDLQAILNALLECGLAVWNRCMRKRDLHGNLELLNGLEDFREHLGGRLTLAMPDAIGRKREIHQVDRELVKEGIGYLEQRQTQWEGGL